MEQDTTNLNATFSYMTQETFFNRPDVTLFETGSPALSKDQSERLKLAINDMRIGGRIHDELSDQGRTVTWLAKQLCMERTSLYYTFRQNSINIEMLMKISAYLGHNFMQDLADIYKKYGL